MIFSQHTYKTQEVRESLGNVAALGQLSHDLVRESSEAGPSGSSLFSDSNVVVTPLDSAQDFTEIDELADDDQQFKACVEHFLFINL